MLNALSECVAETGREFMDTKNENGMKKIGQKVVTSSILK
jgi:hypothetical protein